MFFCHFLCAINKHFFIVPNWKNMFVICTKIYFVVLCEMPKKSKETFYSLFKLDI